MEPDARDTTDTPVRPVTRRRFLLEASPAAGLLALGAVRADGVGAAPIALQAGPRVVLPEPGPMLPPVPAVLLTVRGKDDDPDHISVVWTFVINGDPPQIGIAPAHEHVAGELVDLHGEFVLNVPTTRMVEGFDRVDMTSSRVGDKFTLSGFTAGQAVAVDAPTVEESPIHVECRVFDRHEVPPSRALFLADVVATTVHAGACDETGRLIVDDVPFFGMTAGSGEFYAMGARVGNIGMTMGRSDIRY